MDHQKGKFLNGYKTTCHVLFSKKLNYNITNINKSYYKNNNKSIIPNSPPSMAEEDKKNFA
jgi:hypothetical protein